MANYKFINYQNMETFAAQLKAKYAKQTDLDAAKSRIEALENVGSQANVLEGVKVNDAELTIADKKVNITVATGDANGNIKVNGADVPVKGLAAMAYKANVAEADLAADLKAVIDAKAEADDVYTKTEIDGKISSVYKPAGTVAFADLPTAAEAILGNVYNVSDAFTSTAAFVEGVGSKYGAGQNVVVVKVGEEYKYDVLSGFVDLSGYVEKETGKRLITSDEATKLNELAAGSTKVESSTTNGNIKINGEETTVYTLPATVIHDTNFTTVTDAEMIALLADATPEA